MGLPLATYYAGWAHHNGLLIKMLEPLGPDELRFRGGENLWPVGMQASHIVATRAWWFGAWMGEGPPGFADMALFDEGEAPERRGAAEIVEGLRTSWSVLAECLERWTDSDLEARFQRPARNAEKGRPWRDRRYIVWHVAEHDVHHGGEISLLLGMHGKTGIDI